MRIYSFSGREIDVFWEMECILKGKDIDKRIVNSDYKEITSSDDTAEKLMEMTSEDLRKCQSVTFTVQIKQDSGRKAEEYWDDVVLRQWMEDEVKVPQYLSLFKQNGFGDLETVGFMTLDDLKEMGVEKLGERRRIIAYIRKMKQVDESEDSS